MSHSPNIMIPGVSLLVIGLLLIPLLAFCYRTYLRVGFGRAALVATLAVGVTALILAMFAAAMRGYAFASPGLIANSNISMQLIWLPACLLGIWGTPLVVRLWGCWIGSKATAEERTRGAVGVRAWLCPSNIFCVLVVAIGLWLGFGFSFLAMLVLGVLVLLAQPFFLSVGAADPVENKGSEMPPPGGAELAEERQQVLQMLETGKIGPDDASELLRALGEAQAPSVELAPPAGPRVLGLSDRLVLVGAVIVLVAFFLPWFSFNLGQEMERMIGHLGGGQFSRGLVENAANFNARSVQVFGSDVSHGRGWLILIAALGVGGLTLAPRPGGIDIPTWLPVVLWAVGAGLMIVIAAGALRGIGFGFVILIAGYALIGAGVIRARRTAAVEPIPQPAR